MFIRYINDSTEKINKLFNNRYKLKDEIGKGGFSKVYDIEHKKTNEIRVVKIMYLDEKINTKKSIENEIKILTILDNPGVVKLIETYESNEIVYLIFEKIHGKFIELLAKLKNYNEQIISKIFYKILLIIKYLHSNNIVHRDLKFSNIMWTYKNVELEKNQIDVNNIDNIEIKIIDFGLSAIIKEPKKDFFSILLFDNVEKLYKKDKQLKEIWGTKEYMAPEIYKKKYGRQIDVWSLGCILYEMLIGNNVCYNLSNNKVQLDFYYVQYKLLSSQVQKIMKKMLKSVPAKRISINELIDDKWIKNNNYENNQNNQNNYLKELEDVKIIFLMKLQLFNKK